MLPNEMILHLLEERSMSQRALAKKTGYSPQTVNNQLCKSKSMRLDSFASMLDALGYELKIVPKEERRPELTLDIERREDEESPPQQTVAN